MNKLLGEIEIEIKDQKFVLRPTFGAAQMIEELSGKTVSTLVNKILKADVTLKEIVSVLYGGISGGLDNKTPPMSFDELGNMVLVAGMGNFFKPCAQILCCIYTGKPVDTPLNEREDTKIGAEKPDDQEKKVLIQDPIKS